MEPKNGVLGCLPVPTDFICQATAVWQLYYWGRHPALMPDTAHHCARKGSPEVSGVHGSCKARRGSCLLSWSTCLQHDFQRIMSANAVFLEG